MTIKDLISRIISEILSPALFLIFSIALIVFLWGVMYYVVGAQGNDTKLKQGKWAMLWGIIGMSVMFSAWGLVRLVCNTFGTCQDIGIIDSLFPGGGGDGRGGGGGQRNLPMIPRPEFRPTPRPGVPEPGQGFLPDIPFS